MISPRRFRKSMKHALKGVRLVFKTEQSFRIQVVAGIGVIVFAGYLGVQVYEWIILLVLIGAVLSLELINSVFERIADAFKPRIHPMVKEMKDIMAGTVLIGSVLAAVIGFLIFWPYLWDLVSQLS